MPNRSGVEVPDHLFERGQVMLTPLIIQAAKDAALGRDRDFTASGVYQHAVLEDDRRMVAAMLAAAIVLLGQGRTHPDVLPPPGGSDDDERNTR